MSTDTHGLTQTSLELFLAYAEDGPNWSGTPLVGGNVGGTKEERGNLTQLKRAGLITTFRSDGHLWLNFTAAGEALAHAHGLHTGRWGEARPADVCPDCGQVGERAGHMECMFPEDH